MQKYIHIQTGRKKNTATTTMLPIINILIAGTESYLDTVTFEKYC